MASSTVRDFFTAIKQEKDLAIQLNKLQDEFGASKVAEAIKAAGDENAVWYIENYDYLHWLHICFGDSLYNAIKRVGANNAANSILSGDIPTNYPVNIKEEELCHSEVYA